VGSRALRATLGDHPTAVHDADARQSRSASM
jgi:hypothetical protein